MDAYKVEKSRIQKPRTIVAIAIGAFLLLSSIVIIFFLTTHLMSSIPLSVYSIRKGVVYYDETPLKDADASSFQTIADTIVFNIAKTKDHVYVDDTVLEGADPNSFQQINKDLYRDDTHVFQVYSDENEKMSGHVVSDDPKHFTVYGSRFVIAKDSKNVYAYIESGGDRLHVIPNADPGSLSIVSPDRDLITLIKDKNHVYSSGEIVKGADPATFAAVPDQEYTYYYKDARRVYSDDGGLVSVVSEDAQHFIYLGKGYAKDMRHVYFGQSGPASRVDGADVPTFSVVPTDFVATFGKDKAHVFSQYEVFGEADPNSFAILSNVFSRDKNHIYVNSASYGESGEPLKGADPQTFVALEVNDTNTQYIDDEDTNAYGKDKNHYYDVSGNVLKPVK